LRAPATTLCVPSLALEPARPFARADPPLCAQVPAVLSHDAVTHWIKSADPLSFATCKRLIRTEGLLVGGSSGASVGAALEWLKSEEGWNKVGGVKGMNVVVVLPDSCVSLSLHDLLFVSD